ncbi:lysophospholipid acyltransferase 5-like [Diadema antillarum]|uniref:lysophospholipid acyltransferase 5-like n=1 Tax=Diadema antillarum TaxID=105358 RepID=UPI003A8A0536
MASAETSQDTSIGIVASIADRVGIGEAALRLLISVFVGYPLSLFLRDNLHGTSAVTKHLYVIATGLAIAYFNYGTDISYLLFCCLVNYVLLFFIGGTATSVFLSFLFNMGYLVGSYIVFASDNYDMNWTTPQCILTLRMISVAYDLYDGHRPLEKLSSEQKSLCIKEAPGPVEMISYSFFFGYFLSGPQYPLRNYRAYMEGKLLDNEEGRPSDTFQPAMHCLGLGIFYLIVEATISPLFTEEYFLTSEYAESSFFYKLFYIALFGKFILNKYLLFWLLGEGICILSGIAYNGKDESGKVKWDACIGIRPLQYECALSVRDMVTTFNLSTNTWVARYVYKRLKFLGNRYVSQVAALSFLALWHGLHVGYYICFMLEFVMVLFDVQATELFEKVPALRAVSSHPLMALPKLVFRKFTVLFLMGYALISFTLMKWSKIHQAYKEIYYICHIFFYLWPVLSFGLIMPWLKAQKKKMKEKEDGKSS